MKEKEFALSKTNKAIVFLLCALFLFPFQLVAEIAQPDAVQPEIKETAETKDDSNILLDRTEVVLEEPKDSLTIEIEREIMVQDSIAASEAVKTDKIVFNPDPNRAVWLSALFPGLGQVYNRRYWKLPIVAGGFMGISYALSWNNRMYSDYTTAYRDAMDNDPGTKSYLDFFHSNVKEEDIDMTWLKKTLKSRKDFYRRNRDLSIICMVGMYILCMVDAYVDASLSHFDISPDLSMDVAPAIIEGNRNGIPSFGLQWALNF